MFEERAIKMERLRRYAKRIDAWVISVYCKHNFSVSATASDLGLELGTVRCVVGKAEYGEFT